MINNFKNIGQSILAQDSYYEANDLIEKRKKFLFHQSLMPYEKQDKNMDVILNGRAICLNFDLEKKQFEFKMSNEELIEENREYFFGFKLGAPKDKKKFLITNNIETFYSALFRESLEYLSDKKSKNISKQWFEDNISEDYKKLLSEIFYNFYTKGKLKVQKGNKKVEDYYLNFNILCEKQREIIQSILTKYKTENKEITINELYNRFLNKYFFNAESKDIKNFSSIFLILINNQHIVNYENGKYRNDYINTCYYDLIERFFTEKSKKNKQCHICKNSTDVIQDIPLSMKFYGTTNVLNFENVSSSNAYKSFAICNDCLVEVLTGMKFIEHKFDEYMFDMNCYLIPLTETQKQFDYKIYKGIVKVFKTYKSKYKNEIEQLQFALKKANKKDANFDLMFYNSPPGSQLFDILKYISNIELKKLIPKLEMFDEMSEKYLLDKIGKTNNSLTLNDLRYYLFPSFLSHKNPDFNVYGKNLLNFLESFLTDNKINYNNLVSSFIRIFHKRLNRDNVDILSAFKMVLTLKMFSNFKILKKGGIMNKGKFISEISKKEYQEFFDTHSDIYGDNAFRQGLFLLGTVISKIKFAQKGKSSNILKKLNFDGIPSRRIPNMVNQVRDFANIYKKKVYEEPGIWGNILDRLQGIENSKMKPDEIVFYILTGISFVDYLGMKFAYEKTINEVKTNEGE